VTSTVSNIFYGTSGPRNAKIMFVGEAWGKDEKRAQLPFVGASGRELKTMLSECGIKPADCFFTNLVPDLQPYPDLSAYFDTPDSTPLWGFNVNAKIRKGIEVLRQQIEAVDPTVIIALGNFALWALCDDTVKVKREKGRSFPTGIMSWRGSMLTSRMEFGSRYVLPTLHPALVMRAWEWRQYVKHDLRSRIPMALCHNWNGPPVTRVIFPTFEQTKSHLEDWLRQMDSGKELIHAVDIETKRRNITCIGIATSKIWSICIPLSGLNEETKCLEDYYESAEQECEIRLLLRKYLRHPNLKQIGQNYLYDMQYCSRDFSAPDIKCYFDTMLAQHAMFPGTPKSLDMLASLYCDYYTYWKDDNAEWDQNGTLEQHFTYNCTDVLRTFEIYENQLKVLKSTGSKFIFDYLMKLQACLFRMMLRGIRIDFNYRRRLVIDPKIGLNVAAAQREKWLLSILPQELLDTKSKVIWPNSPKQTADMFYEIIGMKPQKSRKTGNVSTDDETIEKLERIYPEFTRIFEVLRDLRSIGVFNNNFLSASVDADGRMRTSFNPGGTETFRLSSQKNAFGGGTNFQNIPSGDD
jgi:uracil-DNA glycosylase family 4